MKSNFSFILILFKSYTSNSNQHNLFLLPFTATLTTALILIETGVARNVASLFKGFLLGCSQDINLTRKPGSEGLRMESAVS